MSIASELTALNGYILGAYDEINTKGGTVPANKNMANLATAIGSISTGSSTTITPLSVTENGTYTAPTGTAYSPVTVNVSGGESIGITREVTSGGMYRMPADNFTFSLPANATSIGSYALYYAFYGCTSLTSVNLSSLTTVPSSYALANAFYNCTSLTSVDLSSLTRVTGSYGLYCAFYGCTSLTSVDLSSLTTVPGSNALNYAFYNCTGLTSVDLSSLTALTGPYALNYAFRNCPSLTSVDLSSLTTVSGRNALDSAFNGCTSLTSLSFPALTTSSFGTATNQFNNMLTKVRGCTVHFPASVQSTIGSWASVTGGFGGTNTTVLFDL